MFMPLGQPFLGEFKQDTKVVYLYIFIHYLVVNIKPPRHRFGLSLCLGLAKQGYSLVARCCLHGGWTPRIYSHSGWPAAISRDKGLGRGCAFWGLVLYYCDSQFTFIFRLTFLTKCLINYQVSLGFHIESQHSQLGSIVMNIFLQVFILNMAEPAHI